MAPPKPKSKVTDHPFKKPSADVILRSSDKVDFHVHKVVLSDASSVFETMFTLPEGAEWAPSTSNLPVVQMQENSQVLYLLLGVLYPGKGPVVTDAARAADVLAVADKYAMDGVMNHIEHVLCALNLDCGRYIPVMNMYALARRHGFKQLAGRAARASLQHNVLAYSLSGLKNMTLEHYHDLLAYRQACVDVIEDYLPSYDDEDWEDVWENISRPRLVQRGLSGE